MHERVTGASANDLVTTESFYVSSVLNAIPAQPNAVTSTYINYQAVGTNQLANNAVGTAQLANGSATAVIIDAASANGTGAIYLPSGTTAQRPSSPVNGLIRYNTDANVAGIEGYINGSWLVVKNNSYQISYLAVAGGGGGGCSDGNGAPAVYANWQSASNWTNVNTGGIGLGGGFSTNHRIND